MEEDLKGVEPTLNAEAGATADAARVAGGFVDDALHAGFIDKQTPLPPAEPGRPEGHPPVGVPTEVIEGLHLELAVERLSEAPGPGGDAAAGLELARAALEVLARCRPAVSQSIENGWEYDDDILARIDALLPKEPERERRVVRGRGQVSRWELRLFRT